MKSHGHPKLASEFLLSLEAWQHKRSPRFLMVQTVRFERQTIESSGFKWFVVRFEIKTV